MELLSSGTSPFVRKVLVTLHETGQLEDVTVTSVATTPMAPDSNVAAANPVGKIPALRREDGPALYDSRVITRYLDARSGSGLYPESTIWETLTLEATADGMMEAAVSLVYEAKMRPAEMQYDAWVSAQWHKVEGGLNALNERWVSHLHGPMDAGHIAVGCALGYIDFRMDDRNWRKGRDALAGWYEEFAKRPSMSATVPVG